MYLSGAFTEVDTDKAGLSGGDASSSSTSSTGTSTVVTYEVVISCLLYTSPAQFKKVEGVGYNEYDESLSADQNRRVEVYMYASEQMIKNAEAAN